MVRVNAVCVLVVVLALLLSGCQPITAPPAAEPAGAAGLDAATVTEVEALVEQAMADKQLPAVAVAIVKDGKVVYAKGFGAMERGGDQPVTADSVFLMASIAKTLVGVAVMQLVEQGKVDLDAPVTDYLPYFTLADPASAAITVRQLLSHTAGVPDVEDWVAEFRDKEPRLDDAALEEHVRSLAGAAPLFAPGEDWSYSSLGFEVLGDLIAKVSGQSFEAYMQEHILAPLGMEHSTFLMGEVDPDALVTPYTYDADGNIVGLDFFPYSRTHAPSDGLFTTANDLARFALANLNRGELDGARVLEDATYDLMWTPQTATTWGELFGPLLNNYGLGWWVGEAAGRTVIGGYGAETGYQTHIVLIPEENLALIVFTNLFSYEAGAFHALDLGNAIMERLLAQ